MFKTILLASAVVASLGTAARAAPLDNLLVNGDFSQSPYAHSQIFSLGYADTITGWSVGPFPFTNYNYLYFPNEATTLGAVDGYFNPDGSPANVFLASSFPGTAPHGGNFVALDGDPLFNGNISQVVPKIEAGRTFDLSFDWGGSQLANRFGGTTDSLQFTFGGDTVSTPAIANVSQGWTGWYHDTLRLVTSDSSGLFKILSVGTPNGLPPVAVLADLSLTEVPEPSSLALMGAAAIAAFAVVRRRRTSSSS